MAGPNFTLITELQTLHRRDFPLLASSTILNPLDANPLVDGEWLNVSSATVYQLVRGTGEVLNPALFPVHTERGRYDTQAIGKVTVLMLGMYEAESTVVNTASAVVGSALTVQDVTFQSLTRKGLKLEVTSTVGRVIVGYVTKVITTPVAALRFIHFGNVVVRTST